MNVNKLTTDHCNKLGWMVDRAESFNAYSNRSKDLFGFVDFLAMAPGKLVFIQATSRANLATRRAKIASTCCEAARKILKGGGVIEIWGWSKHPGELVLYQLARDVITLDDLPPERPVENLFAAEYLPPERDRYVRDYKRRKKSEEPKV